MPARMFNMLESFNRWFFCSNHGGRSGRWEHNIKQVRRTEMRVPPPIVDKGGGIFNEVVASVGFIKRWLNKVGMGVKLAL